MHFLSELYQILELSYYVEQASVSFWQLEEDVDPFFVKIIIS
jgi:hypothetical protein